MCTFIRRKLPILAQRGIRREKTALLKSAHVRALKQILVRGGEYIFTKLSRILSDPFPYCETMRRKNEKHIKFPVRNLTRSTEIYVTQKSLNGV